MTTTELELRKNDGSETFVIRAELVKLQISNNIVIKSILSAGGDLAGANPVLAKESYQIDFVIRNTDPGDYPNDGTYSSTPNTDNYGMYEELRRVTKEWGPDTSDGFNELYYDGRTIDAEISDLQITEDRSADDTTRQYSGTIEMSHYSVYIG